MNTFADLFCGGGLGARGAVNAGMTPLVAVDLWKIATDTYKANFPSAVAINDRIEKVNPTDYIVPGTLDLLLASPECTNHSKAKGNATINDYSRDTAFHTVQWVAALRPRWFIIENVVEMRDWHRYQELVDALRSLGYKTSEEKITASDFGAPQSRTRLFLIGGVCATPPKIVPSKNSRSRTVRDILDPDGTWPMSVLFTEGRAEATVARARNAIATLGADAEFLLVYYGSGGEKSWQTLDQPLRTVTTIDRFALVKKVNGKYMMRMLQPSELARAMSLPKAHVFPYGTRRDKIKLCGNGVCSVVTQTIVEQLRDLDGRLRSQTAIDAQQQFQTA